jgi:tetratricopeptide (TPR) repeat protein
VGLAVNRVDGSWGNPMSAPFTVFVCSTFDDLEQEREAVLDAIRRVQSRHTAMEFFGARPGRPINICIEEVRKSDLLVVIVGEKYGSLPPGMGVSYSQAEYEEGVRLEKPCLVYLRDDDVPILRKHVERDPDKLRLLDAWKQTLNAAHTVAKFESWPKLAVQVAADIGHFLLERQFAAQLAETAAAKGVAEAPLREVLKRLGETEVAEAEIPDRLAKAADELLRLRADLARLSNDRPEFAAIRARASALIDKGDFDTARAALNEGRQAARALREEASRTEAVFLADEGRVDRLQLNYDAACAKFTEAARIDPDNVWLWIQIGDLWDTRGSLAEAKKAFAAASHAAARNSDDHDLATSYNKIGDVQEAQGDLAGALTSYRDSLAIIDRLAQSDPGNATWQRDLSVAYSRIGDVQMVQGDRAGALTSYRDSFAIIDRLAQSDPGNASWRYHLSVAHERIGDVQVVQGDLAGALNSYRHTFAIRKRLARSDPGNATWQRDLSVAYNKIGDVEVVQGDRAGALTSYRDSFAIVDQLAQSDPGNVYWQRDLSVVYNKIGDVQQAQGDLAGALTSYRNSLTIIDRLAQSDPGNATWQRDLSVAYNKIGDVQVARSDRAGALTSYRDSFAIIDRLAQSDPGNASWQRDLSVSYSRIGDVQVAQGDRAGALTSYRDSFAIRERLAQSDPGNAGWQRHIAVSHGKIADALKSMGKGGEALESSRQGHAIVVRLTALSPDNVQWNQDLDWFASQIAELSQ